MLIKDLSLTLAPGETLALVGESGSGKSVTANAIMGTLPSGMLVSGGSLLLGGVDLLALPAKSRRKLLGTTAGMVFQNYLGSFTPFIRVGAQMSETLRSHKRLTREQAKMEALAWLEEAGLPAERIFGSYPYQLSGGQLQRAAIATAMMLKPRLLIVDEPTTALDVLAAELVLNLLMKLQQQTGCAVLLISHDLRQALKRADQVAVMKDGRLVEYGTAEQLQQHASHPYTRMLLEAKPGLAELEASRSGAIDVRQAAANDSGSAKRKLARSAGYAGPDSGEEPLFYHETFGSEGSGRA